MASDFDPYRILEIDPSAGQEQIDEAYRRQWAAYPRDETPEARLREIQAAYRILSDPAERRSYDERRAYMPRAAVAVAEGSNPLIHGRVIELMAAGNHQLVRETSEEAELIRTKKFGWGWAVFWVLFGLLPLVLYINYHSSRARTLVRLSIGANGQLVEMAEPLGPPTPVDLDTPAWTPADILRAVLSVLGITFLALIVFGSAAIAVAGSADDVDTNATATSLELVASMLFQAGALWSVWYFGIRKYKLSWRSVGWRAPAKNHIWIPFALVIMAMTLQIAYGIILEIFDVSPDTDLPDAMFENAVPLTMLLITTLAIAPVVEETFFRGFIFGGLRRHWGLIGAGVFSSTLFGLAHVGNPGYFYLLPLVAMLGGIFAWGYYYTKSLYTTIAAHMIFNSIAMIITLSTR